MSVYLDYLEIQITDFCNLNCKGCSHCAGLAQKGSHVPVDSFERDLIRLKTLFPKIDKIRILGGEPFLNPDLDKYFEIAADLYEDADVRVVTNGLLCLKRAPDFYQKMRKMDIGLDITVYPPTLKYLEQIKEMLDSYEIRYQCTDIIKRFVRRINLEGTSDMQSAFRDCTSKGCTFLRDGILSLCPLPIIADTFCDYFGINIDTSAGKINLYDETLTAEGVFCFLNSPNLMCCYCSVPEYFDWEAGNMPAQEDWVVRGPV